MAKKRKDLSGQLDGLFSSLGPEEEAEAREQEPQVVDGLAESKPVAEHADVPEVPATDALLAAEPTEEEEVAEQVLAIDASLVVEPAEEVAPALVEPVELPAEAPAIDGLLAEEVEPEEVETVAPPVAEPEPGPEVTGLPTMAELMAELVAAEEAERVELAEPEEVAPEVVAEVEPKPVAAEPEPVAVEREAVKPVPSALPSWEVMIKEQRVKILNALLIFITAVATLVVGGLVAFSLDSPELWVNYIPYFVAWAILLGLTVARRLDPLWRITGLAVLAYVVGGLNLWLDGPLGAGWLYLLLAPLLLSTLVGRRTGVYAAVGSFGIYCAFTVVYYALEMEPVVDTLLPENWTWTTVLLTLSGTFGLVLAAATMIQWMFNSALVTSLREAGERNSEAMRAQALLQERAEELSVANVMLRERSLQLETASEVSRAASSELDPEDLMQRVVDLIRERFDLYYAGLFLTAEISVGNGADAELHEVIHKAGTGVAGRGLLVQNYRVEVGDDSAVGRCTARGQAEIALQPGGKDADTVRDLLPRTRSEIALPLRSRGRVLGALDVHSVKREAFSPETIAVLQTMADQIAVSIDNAHLFAELRQRLREMEVSQRLYVREQWADFTPRWASPVYERARPDAAPLTDDVLAEAGEVALRREMIVKSGGDGGAEEAALVTPISLRGQIVGALGLQEAEGGRRWTDEEIALIETVVDQMALAIENVRLLEETRQLAGWEQMLSDMTANFTRSLDTQTLLQTAIQELGQLLQVDEVSIHIGAPGELASTGDDETI